MTKEEIKKMFFEVANEEDLDELYEHFYQRTKKYWSVHNLSDDKMRGMYDLHRQGMREVHLKLNTFGEQT